MPVTKAETRNRNILRGLNMWLLERKQSIREESLADAPRRASAPLPLLASIASAAPISRGTGNEG